MTSFAIRTFRPEDKAAVVDLWNACGLIVSYNHPERDIERKLAFQPELFFVGEIGGRIVASCMAGYEGHRGWINYLAVAPSHRRRGFGAALMTEAEKRLRAVGCPKICLQVRRANPSVIRFYEAIGFLEDDVIGLGKRLEPDPPWSPSAAHE